MTIEYDPKFYIECLKDANAKAIDRMDNLEEAFNLLYDATLEIAERTNTIDGKVFAKLEEAYKALHRRPGRMTNCSGEVVPNAEFLKAERDRTSGFKREEES
jgi:hypothetical protein